MKETGSVLLMVLTIIFFVSLLVAIVTEVIKRWLRLIDKGALVLTITVVTLATFIHEKTLAPDPTTYGAIWRFIIMWCMVYSLSNLFFKFDFVPKLVDLIARLWQKIRGRA